MATTKSINDIIAGAVPAVGSLRSFLNDQRMRLLGVAQEYPDTAASVAKVVADIDKKLAVLDSVVSADALAALGMTVMRELAALPSTGLQPLPHPGSVTGG